MSEVGFKRLTIVFISLISLTAILIWAALIIRAGTYLKLVRWVMMEICYIHS